MEGGKTRGRIFSVFRFPFSVFRIPCHHCQRVLKPETPRLPTASYGWNDQPRGHCIRKYRCRHRFRFRNVHRRPTNTRPSHRKGDTRL